MTNGMTHDRYDFGDDAEVVPPADPGFDAWITKVAPALNAPNAAPRLEMWAAIQTARRSADVTPRRHVPWRLMSVIAAALLLGDAIDRVALRQTERASAPVAATPPTAADSSDPSRLYRLAAAQTLTQAEALLTAYRASGVPEQDPAAARELASWGRQVLSGTRLLIDSPAGDDPQLRALLSDLELVLVQIIHVSGAQLEPSERELIDRALEDRDLLPRLRTAVPAGIVGAASGD
ncbi:MAG TPA: hypothetical protein VG106_04905 [Vicinamibacterales bacterium]|nr:hypothetical protein [Vicinamibacterales bacterium]